MSLSSSSIDVEAQVSRRMPANIDMPIANARRCACHRHSVGWGIPHGTNAVGVRSLPDPVCRTEHSVKFWMTELLRMTDLLRMRELLLALFLSYHRCAHQPMQQYGYTPGFHRDGAGISGFINSMSARTTGS